MAAKPELPSALEELEQQPARLNLKSLPSRAEIPDSTIEQNSRSLGQQWGANTRLQNQSSIRRWPKCGSTFLSMCCSR